MPLKTKPGVYFDVPFEVYAEWPELNWSKIKHREHSAAMFRWAETSEDEETVSRAKGRAVHCLILEPHKFYDEFAVWTGKGSRATKAYKTWSKEQGERTCLKVDEFVECFHMAWAVRHHPLTRDIWSNGHPEVSIVWVDPETGLACKARLDWLQEQGVIFDVKGMTDIREYKVSSQIAQQQWHGQAAHYARGGMEALGWDTVNYAVIAVQIKKVPDVGVFNLGNLSHDGGGIEYIHAGDIHRRDLLRLVADDRERGTYPGRYSFEIPLDPPAWATPEGFGLPTSSTANDGDDFDPFQF